MNKVPMSPKARRFAAENNISPSDMTPTGKDGNIRYVRFDDAKRAKLTPLAKKIAKDRKIDAGRIRTKKRISSSDILKLAEEIKNKGLFRLGRAREMIRENLSHSVEETIPYTLFAKVDITKAYEYYRNIKASSDVRITLTDIFLYATAKALKENPIINTTRENGYYIQSEDVNISLAIDMKGNILTPVIRNADDMTVKEIAQKREEYLMKASLMKISSEELEAGTFTVSNLGNSPVGHFTPVINYPQSAILGIGRTDDELYPEDGSIKERKVVHLSLTADHTIIDGKTAAEFLSDIRKYLAEVE